jgi:hypothetical protein
MRRSRIPARCARAAGTVAVALMVLAGGALATPAHATTSAAQANEPCVEQDGDSYYLNVYVDGTLTGHLSITEQAANALLLLGIPRC